MSGFISRSMIALLIRIGLCWLWNRLLVAALTWRLNISFFLQIRNMLFERDGETTEFSPHGLLNYPGSKGKYLFSLNEDHSARANLLIFFFRNLNSRWRLLFFCLLVLRCGKGFDVKILHEDKRIHIPSFSHSIFSDCRKHGGVGEYRFPMQAHRWLFLHDAAKSLRLILPLSHQSN